MAFMIGIGVGFYLTPEYAQMVTEKKSAMVMLGTADKQLDLRYLNNMISHHLAAIDMAKQALVSASRPEIKSLAQVIITTDEAGIKKLYEFKKAWYNNDKVVTKFDKVELGGNDSLFELRFLNALTSHHLMAIEAAKEIRSKSSRTEVLNLADEVITNLSANLSQFEAWRKAWYAK
jgi:uncharacterized protein (DUF305 family)